MTRSISEYKIEIEGTSYTLYKKEENLNPQDLLPLLSQSNLFPKVYWNHKSEGVEYAAFGKLLEFSKLPEFSSSAYEIEPVFFGGLPFFNPFESPKTSTPFSTPYFFLPEFRLEKSERGLALFSFSMDPNTFTPFAFPLNPSLNRAIPLSTSRLDFPNFPNWQQNIENVLTQIKEKKLSKVVLARKPEFYLENPLDPYLLLEFLKKTKINCSFFSFQINPEQTFLGASPETLFIRTKKSILTEAIAGTVFNSKKMILKTQKNLNEFSYVKRYLEKRLSTLCDLVEVDKIDEISTGNLHHLYSSLKGNLKPLIGDFDLLNSLHPTPAVCGSPQVKALKAIADLEPFDRGWYAAPIGKISLSHSQFVVGIRSCLIQPNKLSLFAGCGLVEGSDPKNEWEELEAKINPYLKFLSCYADT